MSALKGYGVEVGMGVGVEDEYPSARLQLREAHHSKQQPILLSDLLQNLKV
jgi:hypothetical protein